MTTTEMTEQDLAQAIGVDVNEPPKDIFKPHPTLTTTIVVSTISFMSKEPSHNPDEILYRIAKEYIVKLTSSKSQSQIPEILFAYYLEAYRTLQVVHHKSTKSKPELYTDAALSIFDLYLYLPTDVIVRRMIALSANALHEVIVAIQSSKEDQKVKEVLGYLTNLAMLSQTVKAYVKGQQRNKNYPYIRWLKTFYETALQATDLSWMKSDPVLADVIKQVTTQQRVIQLVPTIK